MAENQNTAQVTVTPVALPGAPGMQQPSLQDPNVAAQPAVPPLDVSVTALIERARQDEKAKLYGTLEKAKAEVKANAEALAAAEKRAKEFEALANKDLTSDQRIEARITALQEQIAKERQARENEAAEAKKQIQLTQLDAYKHRRLAEVGISKLIPEFVGGDTTEMIDASILVAQAEYQRLRQVMYAEFAAEHAGAGQVPSSVGGIPATPSPHFTPPPGGGFPSQVNPVPVAEQHIDMGTLATMTSEEAVRSGAYEQVRNSLLNNLRQAAGSLGGRPLGATPRHLMVNGGMPHADVGGGVMQPAGFPTGPAHPSQIQPGMAAPGIAGDPRAAAMAAVNRTNAGQNPLLAAQAAKAPTGPMPAGNAGAAYAAFQSRFAPTPPLQ